MISRLVASTFRLVTLRPQGVYQFSEKTWKERDDAAEKVYITQSESNRLMMFRTGNEEIVGEDELRGVWVDSEGWGFWEGPRYDSCEVQGEQPSVQGGSFALT